MSRLGLLLGAGIVVALLMSASVRAGYVLSKDKGGLVPIVNRDFEEPNDGKHTAFDIEQSRKKDAPFNGDLTTDVPGWSTDISTKDSGVEQAGDHGWSCVMMGTLSEWDDVSTWVEPPVWQILGYKIKAGDQFCLSVESNDSWTANWFSPPLVPTLKMSLFFVDIGGARKVLASRTVEMPIGATWATYTLNVADPMDPADPNDGVGRLLGIEFQNLAQKDSWIHVDNVSLIQPVEPNNP
jgi:hypothetical protein